METEKKASLVVDFKANTEKFKQAIAELGDGNKGFISGLEGVHATASNTWGTIKKGWGILSDGVGVIGSVISAISSLSDRMNQAAIASIKYGEAVNEIGEGYLEKYKGAAAGVISESELIASASASLRGSLAITRSDFEDVTRAAIVLSRQGFGDANAILQELTKSLTTGSMDAFKRFGVVIQEGGDAHQKQARALRAVLDLSKEYAQTVPALEEIDRRWAVQKENAAASFDRFIGKYVGGIEVMVEQQEREKIAREIQEERMQRINAQWEREGGLIPIVKDAYEQLGPSLDRYGERLKIIMQYGSVEKWEATNRFLAEQAKIVGKAQEYAAEASARAMNENVQAQIEAAEQLAAHKKRQAEAARRAAAEAKRNQVDFTFGSVGEGLVGIKDRVVRMAENISQAVSESKTKVDIGLFFESSLEKARELVAPFADAIVTAGEALAKLKPPTALEKYWKSIEEKAQNYTETIGETGVGAMKAFGQASGEAMMLLMSGQAGAGETFKAMLHSFAETESSKLYGLAIEATAMALMNSFYNPAAAAGYWASAAVSFAGATLMAGLAGLTKPSEVAASGSAGGGGSVRSSEYSGSSSAANGNTTTVINIGYGFLGDKKSLVRELQGALDEGSAKGWTQRSTVKRSA